MDGIYKNDATRQDHVLELYALRDAEEKVRTGKFIDETKIFSEIKVSPSGITKEQDGQSTNLTVKSEWKPLVSGIDQPDGEEISARIHNGKTPDTFIFENLYNRLVRPEKGSAGIGAVETYSHGRGQPFETRETLVPKSEFLLAFDNVYSNADPNHKRVFLGPSRASVQGDLSTAVSVMDTSGKEIAKIVETTILDPATHRLKDLQITVQVPDMQVPVQVPDHVQPNGRHSVGTTTSGVGRAHIWARGVGP
jgi:hypothetical protein